MYRNQLKTLLQFNNLSLSYGYKEILKKVTGSIRDLDRIGLVGKNGSGKTSLLNLILGNQIPSDGQIHRRTSIAYVAQTNEEDIANDQVLYEYLAEKIYDWRKVVEIYENHFNQEIDPNQLVVSLSGGELVKLHISSALASSPGILLLDEPTNHLDLSSLSKLQELLISSDTPFIVVSHNVSFLNQVTNTIWEIEKGQLQVYGGNYDFYRKQKQKKAEAKSRKFVAKQKEIRRLEEAKKREQRRAQHSKRARKRTDMPRIMKNYFKNVSEKRAGKKKERLERKEEKLKNELSKYKNSRRKSSYINLRTNDRRGLLIDIDKGRLRLPN